MGTWPAGTALPSWTQLAPTWPKSFLVINLLRAGQSLQVLHSCVDDGATVGGFIKGNQGFESPCSVQFFNFPIDPPASSALLFSPKHPLPWQWALDFPQGLDMKDRSIHLDIIEAQLLSPFPLGTMHIIQGVTDTGVYHSSMCVCGHGSPSLFGVFVGGTYLLVFSKGCFFVWVFFFTAPFK